MTYLVLALGVAAFVAGLKVTGVTTTVSRMVTDLGSTAAALRSKTASDTEKEATARAAAVRMLGSLVVILGGLLVGLALSAGLLFGASQFGICTVDQALLAGTTWEALVGATIVTVVLMKTWR